MPDTRNRLPTGRLLARDELGTGYRVLTEVRMQRVQTCSRFVTPFRVSVFTCTFAPNVRFVFGALRCQRPECWWRMLRPNVVPLPQTSHLVAIADVAYQVAARRDNPQGPVPRRRLSVVAGHAAAGRGNLRAPGLPRCFIHTRPQAPRQSSIHLHCVLCPPYSLCYPPSEHICFTST